MATGVNTQVRNAAMKTLFADPHFNLMDGLDVYIDDYGKPDPLPEGMLAKMVQSRLLGLIHDEPAQEAVAHGPEGAAVCEAVEQRPAGPAPEHALAAHDAAPEGPPETPPDAPIDAAAGVAVEGGVPATPAAPPPDAPPDAEPHHAH